MQSSCCNAFHTKRDADLLIVQKAIELLETSDIAVIGDDTDFLVLLLYYGRNLNSHDIYFHPEPKQFAGKSL